MQFFPSVPELALEVLVFATRDASNAHTSLYRDADRTAAPKLGAGLFEARSQDGSRATQAYDHRTVLGICRQRRGEDIAVAAVRMVGRGEALPLCARDHGIGVLDAPSDVRTCGAVVVLHVPDSFAS